MNHYSIANEEFSNKKTLRKDIKGFLKNKDFRDPLESGYSRRIDQVNKFSSSNNERNSKRMKPYSRPNQPFNSRSNNHSSKNKIFL
jgi:hypothetical protein